MCNCTILNLPIFVNKLNHLPITNYLVATNGRHTKMSLSNDVPIAFDIGVLLKWNIALVAIIIWGRGERKSLLVNISGIA